MIVTNVTVIDGTGAPAAAGLDVTIREGRFESVRPAASGGAADGSIIDGEGKFLIPGLWESHTHLRSILRDNEQADLDGGLRRYLERGVTSVIDLGGPIEPFGTLRERWRGEGPAGRAQVFFAGPSFTGIDGWPLPLHHNPALVNQAGDASAAAASLRAQLEHRPDVIKIIYDGEPGSPEKLPREALGVIVAQAHEAGVHVLVHIRTLSDSIEALEAGADGLEHSFLPTPGREQAEADRLTEALLRTGAYLTPTLAAWEQIGRAGDQRYLDELVADGAMSPAEAESFRTREPSWGEQEFPHHPKGECLERLEAAFRLLAGMHRAGVKLACGSDIATVLSRPAATLRELALMARAGIPARDLLVAATRHPAEKLGLGATVGSIEPGKTADALLLDGNPIESLDVLIRPGHLLAIIKQGEVTQP